MPGSSLRQEPCLTFLVTISLSPVLSTQKTHSTCQWIANDFVGFFSPSNVVEPQPGVLDILPKKWDVLVTFLPENVESQQKATLLRIPTTRDSSELTVTFYTRDVYYEGTNHLPFNHTLQRDTSHTPIILLIWHNVWKVLHQWLHESKVALVILLSWQTSKHWLWLEFHILFQGWFDLCLPAGI